MSDRKAFELVVGFLGLVLLSAVVGAVVLSALGSDVPHIVDEVAVGVVGALAGLLSRPPSSDVEAVNVDRVNVGSVADDHLPSHDTP